MQNCDYLIGISSMKQETHRYTILQEAAMTGQIVNRPTLKNVTFFFYENIRRNNFLFVDTTFGHKVCVTQLSRNAGISV